MLFILFLVHCVHFTVMFISQIFFFSRLRNFSSITKLLLKIKKINDIIMHYYFSVLGYGLSFSSFLCFFFAKEFADYRFFNLSKFQFSVFFNIYFLRQVNFLIYRQELLRGGFFSKFLSYKFFLSLNKINFQMNLSEMLKVKLSSDIRLASGPLFGFLGSSIKFSNFFSEVNLAKGFDDNDIFRKLLALDNFNYLLYLNIWDLNLTLLQYSILKFNFLIFIFTYYYNFLFMNLLNCKLLISAKIYYCSDYFTKFLCQL
jgi:hypothetical protein